MILKKNRNRALVALVMMLALAFQLTTPLTNASDHIDGPQLANDHASDINDMYFFLNPNDNSRVVMVMTINPFLISSEIIGQAIFDHNLRYRFEIENNGDATPDIFFDVRFTRGVGRETGPQIATIQPSVANPPIETRTPFFRERPFNAPTNVPTQGADVNDIEPPALNVTTDSFNDIRFFAGITDDPFFLDNTAANRFVLSSIRNPGNPNRQVFANRAGFNAIDGSDPNADNQTAGQLPGQARNRGLNQGAGRDTYAGFNTLLIALDVPVGLIRSGGNELGLNGVTQRQQTQTVRTDGQVVGTGPFITVDREGNPLVNNGLIPPARKDEYNGATTQDDANGRFRADIIQSLRNFGTNDTHINIILNMIQVRGDILRLDLRVPNNGPGGGNNASGGPANMGGRRLQDDVADGTFTLINNGQPLGDFVDGNEFEFGDVFPFVAPQIMPNPNGINSRDTRLRL
jgi:hypothetical protein